LLGLQHVGCCCCHKLQWQVAREQLSSYNRNHNAIRRTIPILMTPDTQLNELQISICICKLPATPPCSLLLVACGWWLVARGTWLAFQYLPHVNLHRASQWSATNRSSTAAAYHTLHINVQMQLQLYNNDLQQPHTSCGGMPPLPPRTTVKRSEFPTQISLCCAANEKEKIICLLSSPAKESSTKVILLHFSFRLRLRFLFIFLVSIFPFAFFLLSQKLQYQSKC